MPAPSPSMSRSRRSAPPAPWVTTTRCKGGKSMRGLRLTLWIAIAVALFVLGALSVGVCSSGPGFLPAGSGAGITPGAPLGGAFRLVDHEGRPVTEEIFRGKPSAVFFGFTHCPDVCPTTLMEATGWIEAL